MAFIQSIWWLIQCIQYKTPTISIERWDLDTRDWSHKMIRITAHFIFIKFLILFVYQPSLFVHTPLFLASLRILSPYLSLLMLRCNYQIFIEPNIASSYRISKDTIKVFQMINTVKHHSHDLASFYSFHKSFNGHIYPVANNAQDVSIWLSQLPPIGMQKLNKLAVRNTSITPKPR